MNSQATGRQAQNPGVFVRDPPDALRTRPPGAPPLLTPSRCNHAVMATGAPEASPPAKPKFALETRWTVDAEGHEVEFDTFRPFHNADPFDPEQVGDVAVSPRFASWRCKDFSLGAPVRTPYRRDQTTFAGGYSGFKPRWQPDTNPIQGGRSDKIYQSGKVTKPGYSGFRPGEKADPFIDFKVRPARYERGAPRPPLRPLSTGTRAPSLSHDVRQSASARRLARRTTRSWRHGRQTPRRSRWPVASRSAGCSAARPGGLTAGRRPRRESVGRGSEHRQSCVLSTGIALVRARADDLFIDVVSSYWWC
eukprot:6201795-Prymnesium_polylepis.3